MISQMFCGMNARGSYCFTYIIKILKTQTSHTDFSYAPGEQTLIQVRSLG